MEENKRRTSTQNVPVRACGRQMTRTDVCVETERSLPAC